MSDNYISQGIYTFLGSNEKKNSGKDLNKIEARVAEGK